MKVCISIVVDINYHFLLSRFLHNIYHYYTTYSHNITFPIFAPPPTKIKTTEYDDYYNSNLDDSFERGCSMLDESEISDDDEIDDFEARYLKTGIDLNLNSTPSKQGANAPATTVKCDKNVDCNQQQQDVAVAKNYLLLQESSGSSARVTKSEESLLNNPAPSHNDFELNSINICTDIDDSPLGVSCLVKQPDSQLPQQHLVNENFSDTLSKMAIQHLTQHQWQLPLLEMDCIFRDRTYFKHYADSYISNLQSKLGLFMSSIQTEKSDLRCHNNQYIKDNMLSTLVDYYKSLHGSFFSFSTPSPDEEIVIGCRFGSKGLYQYVSTDLVTLTLLVSFS